METDRNAGAGVVGALQLDPSVKEQMEIIDAPPLPGNTPPASPLRAAPNMTWDSPAPAAADRTSGPGTSTSGGILRVRFQIIGHARI